MDERIRQRAYEIWEREGRPEGREAEHWRMAAEELSAPSAPGDTQDVPAARVRGPAKLDESAGSSGMAGAMSGTDATPATTAPAAPSADPQADPLGLAQQTAKPARKRNAPRNARTRPGAGSPSGNGTDAPDRSR
jgi:hypothetical protein